MTLSRREAPRSSRVTSPGGTGSFSGTVLRLNRRLFLIRSTGQDPSRESRRSLARLVRLVPVSLSFGAAISVTGQLVAGGGSLDSGRGSAAARAGIARPTGAAVAGVAVRDAGGLSVPGLRRLLLHPGRSAGPGRADPGRLGVARRRRRVLGGAGGHGHQRLRRRGNGQPLRPWGLVHLRHRPGWTTGGSRRAAGVPGCARYYPVIYARGDLRITGGGGQGILLVGGDLDVEGGFAFDGPVVVRGKLTRGARRGPVRRRNQGFQRASPAWKPRGVPRSHFRVARSPTRSSPRPVRVRWPSVPGWRSTRGVAAVSD